MDFFGRKAQLELVKLRQVLGVVEAQLSLERRAASEKLHEAQITIARLEERLKPFQASDSPRRLYKTEDEEEAEFAFERGHIDVDEYERILRKAGFENANVELAPDVSDIVY